MSKHHKSEIVTIPLTIFRKLEDSEGNQCDIYVEKQLFKYLKHKENGASQYEFQFQTN